MSIFRRSIRHIEAAAYALIFLASCGSPQRIVAQIFNGGGLSTGVNETTIAGVSSDPPAITVEKIVETALSYLALIAVIMIIIAGFYLVLSLGEEEKKEKAKRIIFYTLIGLLVVFLAQVIVKFFLNTISS